MDSNHDLRFWRPMFCQLNYTRSWPGGWSSPKARYEPHLVRSPASYHLRFPWRLPGLCYGQGAEFPTPPRLSWERVSILGSSPSWRWNRRSAPRTYASQRRRAAPIRKHSAEANTALYPEPCLRSLPWFSASSPPPEQRMPGDGGYSLVPAEHLRILYVVKV